MAHRWRSASSLIFKPSMEDLKLGGNSVRTSVATLSSVGE